MTSWQDYQTDNTHTVVGTLKVCKAVYSPQLQNKRDLLVWLPPSYASSQHHYPVLYMHDGQNLFDQHTSYAGEWQVDETLTALADEGIEAIVVGIPNIGNRRLNEYSPFFHAHFGRGQGAAYMEFLVNTIKPMIDHDFRTLPDPSHTGMIGSSMGGLISLYGLFEQRLFGLCGALSPAFHYSGHRIFDFVKQAPFRPAKIYLDVGTQELTHPKQGAEFSARYIDSVRKMRDLLTEKGYAPCYVEDEGAGHNETAWAKRLPSALRFLLK